MATARFRFHGELSAFIAPERRNTLFDYHCARAATMKHAVEALGVPHTEIGRLLVDGSPATLARIVRPGNVIEVFPHGVSHGPAAENPTFIADAHLGGLARFLRILGFDTLYQNTFTDRDIVRIAAREHRIVLTRDRALLKCRDVSRGRFVHATRPEAQIEEVAARYALASCMRPFTLCLRCNLPLATLRREEVAGRIPLRTASGYAAFSGCPGCGRIYWEGSHWTAMRRRLSMLSPGGGDAGHGP